ncbi:MAG: hypothetical protein FWH10_00190 [Oscillospiraceae bacterium]|nr:hypothetical protein [Oscillospiraceae bacterium]
MKANLPKRIASAALILAMIISFFTFGGLTAAASPVKANNNGFIAAVSPGSPPADSIAVGTAAELAMIGTNPSYPLNGTYHLSGGITLDGEWKPIGDFYAPFTGVFDGRGNTIEGLRITGRFDQSGLFGAVEDATIRNLGLTGVGMDVSSGVETIGESPYAGEYQSQGGIAGMVRGISVIDNCYVTGSIINRVEIHWGAAGGIAGRVSVGATISNSYNAADITARNGVRGQYFTAGGIAGMSSGVIENCYNTGTILSDSSSSSLARDVYAGGIVGSGDGYTITNCYNLGSVSGFTGGGSGVIGGIAGHSSGGVNTFTRSFNAARVTLTGNGSGGNNYIGGIAGGMAITQNPIFIIGECFNSGDIYANFYARWTALPARVGGIIGFARGIQNNPNSSKLTNCYNTGNIKTENVATAYTGGISGEADCNAAYTNCYNTGNIEVDTKGTAAGDQQQTGAYTGAITGRQNDSASWGLATFTNVYWNTDSDQIINGESVPKRRHGWTTFNDTWGFGLTTEQMKNAATAAAVFAGFDFDTIWAIEDGKNDGYPFLRNAEPIRINDSGDVIVPSDNDGIFINLTQERITLAGFAVKAYSVNGGVKWKKWSKPFDDKLLAKLLNKETTLHLTSGELDAAKGDNKGKPAEGAAVVKFPKIDGRPKETRKLTINYAIAAGASEPGGWVIADGKAAAEAAEKILVSQRIENKTDIPVYSPVSDGGIPVLTTEKAKDVRFIKAAAKYEGNVYTPSPRPKKVTARSLAKAPKVSAKNGIMKLKASMNYTVNGGEVRTTGASKQDIEVKTGDKYVVWAAATASKPASAKTDELTIP